MNWVIRKDPDAGKDWGQEEKGTMEDEMVGWRHWLNGHEFQQIPGDGNGQGSLACCSPWGRKESDMIEWLNWTGDLGIGSLLFYDYFVIPLLLSFFPFPSFLCDLMTFHSVFFDSFSLYHLCIYRFFLCDYYGLVVQSLSRVRLFATPWTAAHQASLSFTVSWSLLKLMSIESVMPSNHLILCHPLLLLPSIFPSIRVFSNELALCIRWPKYWSFSFSISPFYEYSGLIDFL